MAFLIFWYGHILISETSSMWNCQVTLLLLFLKHNHTKLKSKTGSEKDSTRWNRKPVTNPLCQEKKKKKKAVQELMSYDQHELQIPPLTEAWRQLFVLNNWTAYPAFPFMNSISNIYFHRTQNTFSSIPVTFR